MKRFLVAVTLISLTFGIGLIARTQHAIAQASNVGPKVKVGNYSVHPPQGYKFQPLADAPHPSQGYAFFGPSRPDGSVGHFIVLYRPTTESESADVDYFMQKRLESTQKYYDNWLQSGLELVSVNGVNFHRIRWVGIDRESLVPMRGFVYVTIHENEVIYLSSQDRLEYQADLNLANAAAMSFTH